MACIVDKPTWNSKYYNTCARIFYTCLIVLYAMLLNLYCRVLDVRDEPQNVTYWQRLYLRVDLHTVFTIEYCLGRRIRKRYKGTGSLNRSVTGTLFILVAILNKNKKWRIHENYIASKKHFREMVNRISHWSFSILLYKSFKNCLRSSRRWWRFL